MREVFSKFLKVCKVTSGCRQLLSDFTYSCIVIVYDVQYLQFSYDNYLVFFNPVDTVGPVVRGDIAACEALQQLKAANVPVEAVKTIRSQSV